MHCISLDILSRLTTEPPTCSWHKFTFLRWSAVTKSVNQSIDLCLLDIVRYQPAQHQLREYSLKVPWSWRLTGLRWQTICWRSWSMWIAIEFWHKITLIAVWLTYEELMYSFSVLLLQWYEVLVLWVKILVLVSVHQVLVTSLVVRWASEMWISYSVWAEHNVLNTPNVNCIFI